jgi:hemerythrin-like domain-containing protein
MAMDAVELIKQDHRTVDGLFKQFEGASSAAQKGNIVNQVIRELSIHAAIEEEILYPAVRDVLPDGDEMVGDFLEEHHEAKELLKKLDRMDAGDHEFDPTMRTLMQEIRHHVEEEEQDTLPKFKQRLDAESLREIGEELEKAKRKAPTRPHPMAPDKPPGIKLAGPPAALLDRIRDRLEGRTAR